MRREKEQSISHRAMMRTVGVRKKRESCVVPTPTNGTSARTRDGLSCLMRRISTLITRDITLCICSRLRDYNGTTSARSAATRTLTIRGQGEKTGCLFSSTKTGGKNTGKENERVRERSDRKRENWRIWSEVWSRRIKEMMKIDNLEIYDSRVYIFLLFLTEDLEDEI